MDIFSKSRLIERCQDPMSRILHNEEFVQPISESMATSESSRCLDCGTPFCRSGCPVENDIPGFNRAVMENKWHEAYKILRRTNPFPEFTGRVCPAPCESACTMGLVDDPVAIETMEKKIADFAEANGYTSPRIPLTRYPSKIAIVGSGPAGLSAAYWLNQWGHYVTVFEKAEVAGGLLANGIPNFKLAKDKIMKRLQILETEGVEIITRCNIGVDISGDELLEEFDSVLLACGSTKPRIPEVVDPTSQGVLLADDFLKEQIWNSKERKLSLNNKKILILGGGDTGSDCVGSSLRQGATQVIQLEITERPEALGMYPRLQFDSSARAWPKELNCFKTTSSHEEGCQRIWSQEVTGLLRGKDDELIGVTCKDLTNNTTDTLHCDLIVIATGYLGAEESPALKQLSVALDHRNRLSGIRARTAQKRIYTAGDMRSGASLVVNAIAEGRTAAISIHQDFLKNKASGP